MDRARRVCAPPRSPRRARAAPPRSESRRGSARRPGSDVATVADGARRRSGKSSAASRREAGDNRNDMCSGSRDRVSTLMAGSPRASSRASARSASDRPKRCVMSGDGIHEALVDEADGTSRTPRRVGEHGFETRVAEDERIEVERRRAIGAGDAENREATAACQHVGRGHLRERMAGGLDHHVGGAAQHARARPRPAPWLARTRCRLRPGPVRRQGRVAHVGHHEASGSPRRDTRGREQADRACSDHRDAVGRRDGAALHGMQARTRSARRAPRARSTCVKG